MNRYGIRPIHFAFLTCSFSCLASEALARESLRTFSIGILLETQLQNLYSSSYSQTKNGQYMTTRWRCLCKDMYTVKNFYGRLVDGSTAIRRRFASLPTHALSVKYLFICTSLKRKKWGANHTKNIALGFSKPVYILLCIHNVSNCNFQTHSCRLLINSTH